MNPEQAPEALAPARKFIAESRVFYSELAIINEEVELLRQSMDSARDSLADIAAELTLGEYKTRLHKITLQKVDATRESTDEAPLPDGVLEVRITPLEKMRGQEGRDTFSYMSTTVVGSETQFELEFSFRTTDQDNAECRDLKEVERTFEARDHTPHHNVRPSDRGITPPLKYFGISKHLEELTGYKDNYLPERREEIQSLQSTIKWINEALNDSSLNPWYQELLEERRIQAETERKIAFLEAEREQTSESKEARNRRELAIARSGLSRALRLRRRD